MYQKNVMRLNYFKKGSDWNEKNNFDVNDCN